MDFLFFNVANQPLFTRNDAERAEWTVEQFSFFGLFPFDAGKVIERGQRIAFQDADGNWQAFEIRKAKSYEPDHYQEITAEHIAVAELTDEHVQPKEWANQTAQAALASILTGTLWSIGTVTASGTSSGEISYGSVWQGVNTIASNWNVYILPRITIGPSGITGRYLDITPAQGNWRGLRLSINSNIEEAGVTYDDTNVLTAMYGYGKTSTPEQPITPTSPQPQDLPAEPLTFTDVVWTATAEHPAKPANQAYLENPTAKALYGRNGRNRFGYYQNGDVTDPNVLLDLTWKALKKDSEPLISIEGTLHDLQRLGYADQTIRLHDTAIVEILPAGVEVQREIIQLDVDLLNPLATRVTIGAYIPNIIYINKETSAYASGSGGYGSGGRRGQTTKEKEWSEFETEISANQYQILLRAWQQNKNNEILRQAGIQLNAQGVLVYAEDNELNIGSKLKVNADAITAEVTRATAAEGNLSGRITVNADNITAEVSRATTAEGTLSGRISVNTDNITAEVTRATGAENTLSGRITTEAGKITQIVQAVGSNGEVTAGSVVLAINAQTGQSVYRVDADMVELNGQVLMTALDAKFATITRLESTEAFIQELQAQTSQIGVIYTGGLFINGSGSVIAPTLSASGTLRIGSSSGQGSETGSLYFQGTQYYQRTMRLGTSSPYIFAGKVLSDSNTDVSLNHYHAITATEGTGADAGKVLFESGAVQDTPGSTNFNIADTQFYQDGVSARTAHSLSSIVLSAADIGVSSQPVTVFSLDDEEVDLNVSVDASAVYAAGQSAATFDLQKLTVNIGSNTDEWANSPTKSIGNISGLIGVNYDGVNYGALRSFSISAPKVTSVFHDSRDYAGNLTVYLNYDNGGGRVTFTSQAR